MRKPIFPIRGLHETLEHEARVTVAKEIEKRKVKEKRKADENANDLFKWNKAIQQHSKQRRVSPDGKLVQVGDKPWMSNPDYRGPLTDKKPHIDEMLEVIMNYQSRMVRLINAHQFDEYLNVRKLLREQLDKFGISDHFDWSETEFERKIKGR